MTARDIAIEVLAEALDIALMADDDHIDGDLLTQRLLASPRLASLLLTGAAVERLTDYSTITITKSPSGRWRVGMPAFGDPLGEAYWDATLPAAIEKALES